MIPYTIDEETTDQEIFNIVWKHFVVYKNPRSTAQSGKEDTVCQYRSPEGYACAVGIFLDDETARVFDGFGNLASCMEEVRFNPTIKERFPSILLLEKKIPLLRSFQYCHDKARSLQDVEDNLRKLAKEIHFTIPVM